MDPRNLAFGHQQIQNIASSSSFPQQPGNFLQNPGTVGYNAGLGGQSSLIMNTWLHHQAAQQVTALTAHSAASFPYPSAASQQISAAARFFQQSPPGNVPSQLDSFRNYMTQSSLLTGQDPSQQQLLAQQTQQLLRNNAPTPAAINLNPINSPLSHIPVADKSARSVSSQGQFRTDNSENIRQHSPCSRNQSVGLSSVPGSNHAQPQSHMVHHMPPLSTQTSPNNISPMLGSSTRNSGHKAPLDHLEQIVSGGLSGGFGIPSISTEPTPTDSTALNLMSSPDRQQQRSSHGNFHAMTSHHNQPAANYPPVSGSAVPAGNSGLFPHSVDALEEALVTLSRDYNLESDLTDLNEHLLKDAFFGSNVTTQESELSKIAVEPQMQTSGDGSLLHSILEYDPSTLAQNPGTSEDHGLMRSTDLSLDKSSHTTPQPVSQSSGVSTSAVQPQQNPDGSVVTPKIREKIKIRREKELAEIDKAFDRHLSLVAERNERSAAPTPRVNLPPVTPVAPYPNSVAHSSMSPSNSGTPCLSTADRSDSVAPLSPVRFSPVQFSPSASDNEDAQFGGKSGFGDPGNDELKVFIPLPGKKAKGNCPKVPIYKQNSGKLGGLKPKLEIGVEIDHSRKKDGVMKIELGDSPYEFTDDDDEEAEKSKKKSSVVTPSVADQKKEQQLEVEVARKLMQISSLHPELNIPGMTTRAQQEAVVAAVSRAGFDGRKFQSAHTVAAVQQVINQVTGGAQEANSDLWRHVVPKKRGAKERNSEGHVSQPAAPLLPPVSTSETITSTQQTASLEPTAAPAAEIKPAPLSLAAQLADTMRKRKEKMKEHCFVRTEIILDDDSTAISSPSIKETANGVSAAGGRNYSLPKQEILPRSEDPIEPLLPKVIIRIPKKNIVIKEEPVEEPEVVSRVHKKHKKHKHKKRKNREYVEIVGDNGEIVRKKKKRKKHKHRREHSTELEGDGRRSERRRLRKVPGPEFTSPSSSDNGEQSEGEDPLWKPSRGAEMTDSRAKSEHTITGLLSKKKRLMSRLSEAMAEDGDETSTGYRTMTTSYDLEMDEEAANDQRLAQFRQPTGMLHKGTFVVLKEDIGKTDCPLWRVDNQNLLQKFPPKENSNGITYHSSSTYSGWCPQNSDQYLVVQVRYIQHTRSESIVEPEIPIVDLFPAVSTEVSGDRYAGSELLYGGALSPPECDQHVPPPTPMPDQPIRDALDTYLNALVMHCLSGSFLQNLRTNNEWKFLRHIHDIDSLNGNKKSKLIAPVTWDSKFRNLVEWYPLCTIGDTEGAGLSCQACHKQTVDKVVQLFANEAYDFDTLEPKPPRRAPSGSPQPSQEYLVCAKCTAVTEMYHKLYHMRYHLYRSCEDKIEFIRDENPTAEPAVVLEQCLRNRSWVNHITTPYLDLWSKIS